MWKEFLEAKFSIYSRMLLCTNTNIFAWMMWNTSNFQFNLLGCSEKLRSEEANCLKNLNYTVDCDANQTFPNIQRSYSLAMLFL